MASVVFRPDSSEFEIVGTPQNLAVRLHYPFQYVEVSRSRAADMAPQSRFSAMLAGSVDFEDTNDAYSTLSDVLEKLQASADIVPEDSLNRIRGRLLAIENHTTALYQLVEKAEQNDQLWESLSLPDLRERTPLTPTLCEQRLFNSQLSLAIILVFMSVISSELILWGVQPSQSSELEQILQTAKDLCNLVVGDRDALNSINI